MTSLTITINGRVYGPRDVRDNLTMNDFLRESLRPDRRRAWLWRRAVPELRDHCGE